VAENQNNILSNDDDISLLNSRTAILEGKVNQEDYYFKYRTGEEYVINQLLYQNNHVRFRIPLKAEENLRYPLLVSGNEHASFDGTTFVAPIAGRYLFSFFFEFHFNGHNSYRASVMIRIAGNDVHEVTMTDTGTKEGEGYPYDCRFYQAEFNLNEGDHINSYVKSHSDGMKLYIYNSIEGKLVKAF